jgi:HSP20 family protein
VKKAACREPRLPGGVDAEKVTADMSAGVLTVTVPKAEVTKPRHIRITEINESGGH